MNRQEYLLTCLVEECVKLQQAAVNALKFGVNDYGDKFTTNKQDIGRRFVDVISVMEVLVDDGVLYVPPNKLARIAQKKLLLKNEVQD